MSEPIPVEVITPADPIVLPEQIRGGTSGDTALAAMIAAVTRSIAAPTGWLGRSLGEQTLRWTGGCFPERLPYRPVIEVDSVEYTAPDGTTGTVDPADYRLVVDRLIGEWPTVANEPDAVRITYVAGYESVPDEAIQAIVLGTQYLRDLRAADGLVRSETVEGLGATTYVVSDEAGSAVRRATEALLAGLRVY